MSNRGSGAAACYPAPRCDRRHDNCTEWKAHVSSHAMNALRNAALFYFAEQIAAESPIAVFMCMIQATVMLFDYLPGVACVLDPNRGWPVLELYAVVCQVRGPRHPGLPLFADGLGSSEAGAAPTQQNRSGPTKHRLRARYGPVVSIACVSEGGTHGPWV